MSQRAAKARGTREVRRGGERVGGRDARSRVALPQPLYPLLPSHRPRVCTIPAPFPVRPAGVHRSTDEGARGSGDAATGQTWAENAGTAGTSDAGVRALTTVPGHARRHRHTPSEWVNAWVGLPKGAGSTSTSHTHRKQKQQQQLSPPRRPLTPPGSASRPPCMPPPPLPASS